MRIPLNKNEDNSALKVSVIITARNEEKNLPGLIECLKDQHIENLDVEFILVNDRSEDATAQIINSITGTSQLFKAIHIEERISGYGPKKRAIDTAIKQANGDIILLTDADGRPGKYWVKSMVSYFLNGADMVIGYAPYKVHKSDGIFKKMLALEYFSIASIALASAATGFPITCVGTNMAYRKKVYQELDGFGEYKSFISGDDDLFLTRVREAGNYKIDYATDKQCHVFNNPPKSLNQFVNQRLRYASKGFNYPLKVTLMLATYVVFNIVLLAGLILGILSSVQLLLLTLTCFLLKSLFEIIFLKKAADTLGDRRFLKYYFPASLLHIPYILFFGILGQLKIFKWAEKTAEHGISKKGIS